MRATGNARDSTKTLTPSLARGEREPESVHRPPFQTAFVDRDGVLTDMWTESGWVLQPDELVLLPGAGTAVARLNQAGVLVCAVTNQSCIGRGLLDLRVLGAIHDRLRLLLEAEGARLDGIYTCPHRPDDGCACRKPRPGLLLQAAARHRVDFSRAVVVGDNLTDIEAGRRTGCRTILVRTGDGATSLAALPAWAHQPDHLAADLPAAVDWILA